MVGFGISHFDPNYVLYMFEDAIMRTWESGLYDDQ